MQAGTALKEKVPGHLANNIPLGLELSDANNIAMNYLLVQEKNIVLV